MNEAIRNVAMLVWAVCAINSDAEAQSSRLFISEESSAPQQETMVYGAAKKSSGGEDEFLLEQPAGCGNPLGNPIISGNGGDATASDAQAAAAPEQLPPQKTVPVKIEETLPPVSYTHLTLPTKRIVEISGVAVSLKKKKNKDMERGWRGKNNYI